ncbi:MAG: hypothetical protein A3I61_16495 [Acidobacteria bacterium RIFCSPLOWO2_02_FULL_68_18]|nr:MAG: hypothetical protein A3I61_16495 [Acidobacteria bacterium RIFCSPLOWO2_02_FULL_68_18]OFW48606.1 MAG: hypothetical protein A3G77_13935 [Acidobacteria bacterium RIFCSPLOWO2_12_FULL_68_19]
MACADAVGSHPFALHSLEIARPHHARDLRHISGDFFPESKQIESRGHDDRAIHVSEVRDKVCGFEHGGWRQSSQLVLIQWSRITKHETMQPGRWPLRRRKGLRAGQGHSKGGSGSV